MQEQTPQEPSTERVENQLSRNTITLRVPKVNMQVIVLGLVALITMFQTFQLTRISARAETLKAVPTAGTQTTSKTNGGTGAPPSMVGGC